MYRVPVQAEPQTGFPNAVPCVKLARARAHRSTGYIRLALQRLLINLMESGRRHSFFPSQAGDGATNARQFPVVIYPQPLCRGGAADAGQHINGKQTVCQGVG